MNSDPTPLFSGSTAPGLGSTLAFDTDLGILNPGDTIDVAIGAGATDTNDTLGLKYAITAGAVPEPAGLAMLAAGIIGLVGGAMQRRRASRA